MNTSSRPEAVLGFAALRKERSQFADSIDLYERALGIKECAFDAGHHELTERRGTIGTLRAAPPPPRSDSK